MITSVLFVCTGNICRSPIAQELLIDRFKLKNVDVRVSSAGIAALVDHAADIRAQNLIQLIGLDLSAHTARQINEKIAFNSELILVMSSQHKIQVESLFPRVCGRVHRLGHWGGYDVPDPFRRPDIIYDQVLALIQQGVDEWSCKLWS